MDNVRWYVLYVLTGKEHDVQEALRSEAIEATVPTENRLVRFRGGWTEREYVLMPNYVFIHTALDAPTYHRLQEITGVVRLLKTSGTPSPLPDNEAAWIEQFSADVMQPSTVEFMGGGMYRIVDGVLKAMVNQIEHIDRHRRKARVKLTISGEPHYIELSYRVYQGLKF